MQCYRYFHIKNVLLLKLSTLPSQYSDKLHENSSRSTTISPYMTFSNETSNLHTHINRQYTTIRAPHNFFHSKSFSSSPIDVISLSHTISLHYVSQNFSHAAYPPKQMSAQPSDRLTKHIPLRGRELARDRYSNSASSIGQSIFSIHSFIRVVRQFSNVSLTKIDISKFSSAVYPRRGRVFDPHSGALCGTASGIRAGMSNSWFGGV